MATRAAGRPRPAARGRSAFLTSADGDAVWKPPAGFPPLADDEPAPEPESKPDPPAARPRAQLPSLPRPTLRPSVSDGSGFAFGIVLYAIGLCYIRGGWNGPGGVTDWFRAKFLNQTRGPA